jgi:phosphate transport system permease protein
LFIGHAHSQTAVTAQPTGESETYGEDANAPATPAAPELETQEKPFKASDLVVKDWQPVSLEPKFGLPPLLWGSLKVTLIALLLAGPIGIFAALYTSQFAPKWAKEGMKPAIEILAGFPSVVVGFFALVILASVLQNLFGYQYRLNAFVGGVAMALAVIPIVYTVSEDALAAVPKVMMEASLALGATRWETALFVILPSATPGIFAALILGFGRAFGETMIVLMATGNAALLTPSFVEPVRTLSATIGAEMAEVVFGDTHYRVLFFVGALLFVISFSLNAVAEFFVRNRLMKKFKGA